MGSKFTGELQEDRIKKKDEDYHVKSAFGAADQLLIFLEAALTSLMTLLSSAAAAGAGQVCGGRQREAGVSPDVCEQAG